MPGWGEHAEREESRYRDGEERLPPEGDARQRQLTRMANAAAGAGLAHLMAGGLGEAAEWFRTAAERYRDSYADAPPDSWGRLIGAVKARILAGDEPGAQRDARWALEQSPALTASPIGKYAACLALLELERWAEARVLADDLRTHDGFPHAVADVLAFIAAEDPAGYAEAIETVLRSFETREEHLEDVPVADTVIVMQRLAARRGIEVELESALLPSSTSA